MDKYKQIPHTADLAEEIYGETLPGLYENAAFAMFDMMADMEGVGPEESMEVSVEAIDKESLLISWLNEILYISYIKRMLFIEFNVTSLEENKLTATIKGQKIPDGANPIKDEIKAATHHDLEIKEADSAYEVTVVFDV